jgi:hypothetical protein
VRQEAEAQLAQLRSDYHSAIGDMQLLNAKRKELESDMADRSKTI